MKTILLAAMLTVSSVALAQSSTQDMPAKESMPMPMPSGETTDDGTVPGDGITQQGTDPEGQAMPPMGTNEAMPAPMESNMPAVPAADQNAAFATRPATTEYPPCSRTVTDSCVQTYERGVRRPRRR